MIYYFYGVPEFSCLWRRIFCICCCSAAQLCLTLLTTWTVACQASLSITNSWSLLKLMSIESVMLSNHLILCHSLLPLPSIFLSIRVFSNELAVHIRWQKYWSFSPYNEYSKLISFRTDWFDLLAIQKTLKFSSVQFSHSVVSDSLQPHGLQHARPPCPSPTPGVYSKSSPLSR